MKLKKILPLTGAILIGTAASIAFAAGHLPIEQREAVMKTMGGSAKTIGDMLKGETAFDAEKANEALAAMQSAMAGFGDYFPEGTELQGENQWAAGPNIWSDRAGFDAQITKVRASIDAAVAASPQDAAALGPLFGTIGQSCQSCHEGYRVKK